VTAASSETETQHLLGAELPWLLLLINEPKGPNFALFLFLFTTQGVVHSVFRDPYQPSFLNEHLSSELIGNRRGNAQKAYAI